MMVGSDSTKYINTRVSFNKIVVYSDYRSDKYYYPRPRRIITALFPRFHCVERRPPFEYMRVIFHASSRQSRRASHHVHLAPRVDSKLQPKAKKSL